jgi:hypothetical protein
MGTRVGKTLDKAKVSRELGVTFCAAQTQFHDRQGLTLQAAPPDCRCRHCVITFHS